MRAEPAMILAGVAAMYGAARHQVISADDILRAWSIAGALGGALISSLIVDKDGWRRRVVKFIVSGISGFAFAPALIHWVGWEISADTVMGVAAATAFLSWGGLQVTMRAVPALLQRHADRLLASLPPRPNSEEVNKQ